MSGTPTHRSATHRYTSLAGDELFRDRFQREPRTISSLNHPHICTLHDVGSQDGVEFIVMEYLEGETLAERIARGPLSADETLRLAAQIAVALERAHRDAIVHRDLKPGNVMLVRGAGGQMAKLLEPRARRVFTADVRGWIRNSARVVSR